MNFGLLDEDITYIVNAVQQFPEIEKAAIFGSRAKGKYQPGSDVDIAVWGNYITFSTLSRLHAMLEDESPMPYFFDIVDYSHLTHEDLKKHIDRVGVPFYLRDQSPEHSFRDTLVHARIERSDIQILTKLVEGLGHLGVVTTVDKAQGEVIIQTTSGCWPELERALRHLPVTVEVLEQSHSTNFGKYQTR